MEEKNQYNILVVDDEQDLLDILQFNLIKAGFKVDTATSAEEALQMDLKQYNLFLLDIMMEGMSGRDLAKKIRDNELTKDIPVIFLTALGGENEKISGLEIGADDYIAKPFNIKEVILRINAVLRRTYSGMLKNSKIAFKDLVLNGNKMEAFIGNNQIELTKTEFQILWMLMENKGNIISRKDILNEIWTTEVYVVDRVVDVNVARIRKKIGEYANLIHTRTGVGYYFGE